MLKLPENLLPDAPVTDHDRELLRQARSVRGCDSDYIFSLAEQAQTRQGYLAVKAIACEHYHREEYLAGLD